MEPSGQYKTNNFQCNFPFFPQTLMESSKTMLEKLPLEILLHISYFFDVSSLINLRNSCKQLLTIMDSPKFVSVYLMKNSLLRAINLQPSPSDTYRFFNKIFRRLANESDPRSGNSPDSLEIESVAASTTERNHYVYLTEQSHGFWCSTGASDENGEEYLLYKLNSELAVPALVFIEFAFFSQFPNDSQVFPSKYVQIEFSFVPSKPIYVTPKYEVKSDFRDRSLEIPVLPNILVARYMKVKFIGAKTRNIRRDNLLYICVDSVICFGHKLEKSEKKDSFGGLIHRSVQYFYGKSRDRDQANSESMEEESPVKSFVKSGLDCMMIDESKEAEVSELIDNGYDIERHNQLLFNVFKGESKKDLMSLVCQNLHLLDSEAFFQLLLADEELGESYLTAKAKKCNFLSPLEVPLYLHLVFQFGDLDYRNKEGSYLRMALREKTAYLRELFAICVTKSAIIQRFLLRFLGFPDLIEKGFLNDDSWIICRNNGLIEIINNEIIGIQRRVGFV